MKLISRKALVAGATALSVTFAGTTVATAAEEPTTLSSKTDAPAKPYANDKGSNNADDGAKKKPQTEKTSQEKAEEVQAWIGVFTAAVGALGTLFAFANKYLNIDDFMKNFKLPF